MMQDRIYIPISGMQSQSDTQSSSPHTLHLQQLKNISMKTSMMRNVAIITSCFLVIAMYNPTENELSIARTELLDSVSTPKTMRGEANSNCEIVTPIFAKRTPTALASYPGSGNTMTRVLIEALTGVWTGSTHGNPKMVGKHFRSVGNPADDRLTENVVVVKTHQPGRKTLRWKNATRVILIIRDPLDAIPSACNAKWEIHTATTMHTNQVPEDKWIFWRNSNFGDQLRMWRTMIDFWTKRFDDPDNSMIVIYEDLINVETGPAIAAEMMTFLGHGIIPLESVPCIWQKVVRGSAEKVHRTRRYKPSFLRKQLDQIIGNLTEISQNYKHEPTIERATSLYLDIAKERLN
mmetsp:Transcript_36106/g.84341  ORF Transcript_36106/g.84341 Transcript_36106/m.84341 type:complete len:349 (-) Transcript_36106:222-1268(-)